jgi:hypothetical protein
MQYKLAFTEKYFCGMIKLPKKEFYMDIQTIGVIIALMALNYAYLRNMRIDLSDQMKDLRSETNENFKESRLEFKEIRTSLNRLEGAFYHHEDVDKIPKRKKKDQVI